MSHCKACDNIMEVSFHYPTDAPGPVLENLCPKCLFYVRATLYDGGPPDEMNTLIDTLGIEYDHLDSPE